MLQAARRLRLLTCCLMRYISFSSLSMPSLSSMKRTKGACCARWASLARATPGSRARLVRELLRLCSAALSGSVYSRWSSEDGIVVGYGLHAAGLSKRGSPVKVAAAAGRSRAVRSLRGCRMLLLTVLQPPGAGQSVCCWVSVRCKGVALGWGYCQWTREPCMNDWRSKMSEMEPSLRKNAAVAPSWLWQHRPSASLRCQGIVLGVVVSSTLAQGAQTRTEPADTTQHGPLHSMSSAAADQPVEQMETDSVQPGIQDPAKPYTL